MSIVLIRQKVFLKTVALLAVDIVRIIICVENSRGVVSQEFFCACIEKCYFSVMSNNQIFLIMIIAMVIL